MNLNSYIKKDEVKTFRWIHRTVWAVSKKIYVLTLILIMIVSVIASYWWLESKQPSPAQETSVQAKDIFDTIKENRNFSILATAIKNADMEETLKNDKSGTFTIFAPTDDAFNTLPLSVLDYLLSNKTLLSEILKYHIVAGKIDHVSNQTLTTLQGATLTISSVDPLKVNGAAIIQTEINCSNGVIYAIDKVLQTKPLTLSSIEVHEYQGKDLSSIEDFIENSIKGPQYINKSTYSLSLTGLFQRSLNYTYDDIINKFTKYQKVVTLNCIENWNVTILWEGFLVRDLLQDAGITYGAPRVLIFRAYDGYSTSLPLNYFLNNDIIIAYKMNGVVIPPERGFPFQLVAESKYGYKWIKWITEIELSEDINYKGFWESKGWSNDAGLP